MSIGCCCGPVCTTGTPVTPQFRRALWIALWVNAVMFLIEVAAGLASGSVSLLADAVDFAGDAANYGLSLAVLAMGLAARSRAALVKGLTMTAFGLFVLGKTGWSAVAGIPPEPMTMGAVGALALLANGGVAWMLYKFRDGDADMRSVWLCSRNDAAGNVLVMLAAAGVYGAGSGWPDLLVALVIGGLALSSGITVVRQARRELAQRRAAPVIAPVVVGFDLGMTPRKDAAIRPDEA